MQKQTSFRCSSVRSFPHKQEVLSALISRISEESIWKQDKGGIPAIAEYLRFTPPGNAVRGFYEVSKVLPFQKAYENYAPEKVVSLEPQQF